MGEYDIVLMHGPVTETRYLGDDTVMFTLEDGREFVIRFSIEDSGDGRFYRRDIRDSAGRDFYDETEFDVFGEGFTTEDYAQWTADNFFEIEELIE